jgi:hypothetical protein
MARYKWGILIFVLAITYGVFKAFDDEKDLKDN